MKLYFDKEYATHLQSEVAFLRECGIRYSFVKTESGVSVYKYKKTPELFSALESFYASVLSVRGHNIEKENAYGICSTSSKKEPNS